MAETQDITLPVLAAVSQLPGACFWRQNCGTFRTLDGKLIIRATSIKGVPDIGGHYYGRAVQIETKTKDGCLNKNQKNFCARWTADGGIYLIAHSPEDATKQLRDIQP